MTAASPKAAAPAPGIAAPIAQKIHRCQLNLGSSCRGSGKAGAIATCGNLTLCARRDAHLMLVAGASLLCRCCQPSAGACRRQQLAAPVAKLGTAGVLPHQW
jgi:hypothetical protein